MTCLNYLVIRLSLVKIFLNCFLSYFEQIIVFSTIVTVITKLSTITLKPARITHFLMTIFKSLFNNNRIIYDAIDQKCLSVVTHFVQKFDEHVGQLASVRWEFSWVALSN